MQLLIDVLAGYRILRLIQRDEITLPIRQWYLRFSYGSRFFEYMRSLFTCPWCISIWIAGGIRLAEAWGGEVWSILSWILALSAVVGFLGWLDHERIR